MSQNKKTYCPLPFIAVDVLDKKFSPCAYIEKKIFKKYETIEDYYDSTELKNLQNNTQSQDDSFGDRVDKAAAAVG